MGQLEQRSRRIFWPLIGVATATIAGAVVWGVVQLRQPQTPKVDPLASLTVPVKSEDLTVKIDASGTIRPIQTVNLSPKTSGRLLELYVQQGDRVQKGQLIARMDAAELQSQLARARAGVARAQARLLETQRGNRPEEVAEAEARVARSRADVASAQARLNLARERLERNRLLADEGVIERDRLDGFVQEERSAQADVDRAKALLVESQRGRDRIRSGSRAEDIAAARADLAEARAQVNLVQTQVNDTIVRAPFGGFISQKYAEPGSFVTPTTSASSGSGATSTSIAALARGLEVLARVPEVDIRLVSLGQTVEITADAYPDRVFQGRVKLVAPEAIRERDVTSFEVRVAIASGLDVLRSGMNVDLVFVGERLPQAIVVPTVAVVTDRGQAGVLVPNSERKPVFLPVTLGPSLGDRVQVLQGLKPGDRVFTDLPSDTTLEKILKDRPARGRSQRP
ncbi:MAG: biotin/lipoyl-binding protein [Oscillatoriales cyanobacterium]|nr:MAG: biotin/lipoyl-binding protein [Oscillatoriales cyanobacterium]